jgi:Holliday junction resolvasome RuvABC endonuclease subunit
MSHGNENHKLVLAIDPATKGVGYALFEGPRRPIDWGVKYAKVRKNAQGLRKIQRLIDFYHPDVIVVEDYAGDGSRRCKRVQQLIKNIKRLAQKKGIKTYSYSPSAIRKTFAQSGAKTKYEIAKKIAEWLREFEPRLPPVRKAWMSEDYRMSIFDAVSLALTFYLVEK